MKALVYSDLRRVTMDTRPEPTPNPNEMLLKVSAAGICGSDVAGVLGLNPRRQPGLVLGHELVGTVAKMPQNPPRSGGEWPFQEGQRVCVNPLIPCGECAACGTGKTNICASWRLLGMDKVAGGFAEYVAVAATNVFPLPDHLDDARAVMIEPFANCIHLFNQISKHQFGNLALFGAGTLGSLMICTARLHGYREIAVTDVNPQRLEAAQKLGAKYLINARETDSVTEIRKLFGGVGADIVIDAHGDEAVRNACIYAAKKGGEVMLLGIHDVHSTVDFAAVVRNELRLQGSYTYTFADFAQAKKLIEDGDADLSAWTETLPLEYGQDAFDKLITNPGGTLKIVLTP